MPKAKAKESDAKVLGHPYGLVPGDADLSHIAEGLRHLAVPVSLLCHDPANPRAHDERNLRAIRDSLRRFGQDQPLVVQRDGLVVRKGNGRLDAAVALGWEHVAAVVVDEEDIKAVERALADNRSAELAHWDPEVLRGILGSLKAQDRDLSELGWDPADVDLVLAGLRPEGDQGEGTRQEAQPPGEFPAYGDDLATDHKCPKCGYEWSGKSK